MPPEESPEEKFDRLKKQLQAAILRTTRIQSGRAVPVARSSRSWVNGHWNWRSKTVRTGITSPTVPSVTASSSTSITRFGIGRGLGEFRFAGDWHLPRQW